MTLCTHGGGTSCRRLFMSHGLALGIPVPTFLASSEAGGFLPLHSGLGPCLFIWVASLLPSCQSPSTEESFLPWGIV